VVIIATFGALDEFLQTFTPGRTGDDIYDWTADVLGALTGALLSLLAHDRLRRLSR
jgi:VanZ family protein